MYTVYKRPCSAYTVCVCVSLYVCVWGGGEGTTHPVFTTIQVSLTTHHNRLSGCIHLNMHFDCIQIFLCYIEDMK